MKKHIIQYFIVFISIMLFGGSPSYAKFGTTGNDLYESCKKFASSNEPPKDTMEAVNIGQCVGQVVGIMYLREKLGICVPGGVPLIQGVKVVVKFMDKHPEALNMPFAAIVYWGFNEAFPCPKE